MTKAGATLLAVGALLAGTHARTLHTSDNDSKWCWHEEADVYGYQLEIPANGQPTGSRDDCANLCEHTQGCNAISWSEDRGSKCWLKDVPSDAKPESGSKYTFGRICNGEAPLPLEKDEDRPCRMWGQQVGRDVAAAYCRKEAMPIYKNEDLPDRNKCKVRATKKCWEVAQRVVEDRVWDDKCGDIDDTFVGDSFPLGRSVKAVHTPCREIFDQTVDDLDGEQDGWCWYPDTDAYKIGDIDSKARYASSKDDCKEICYKTNGCNAVTWSLERGSGGKKGKCYLKNINDHVTSLPRADSDNFWEFGMMCQPTYTCNGVSGDGNAFYAGWAHAKKNFVYQKDDCSALDKVWDEAHVCCDAWSSRTSGRNQCVAGFAAGFQHIKDSCGNDASDDS